MSIIIISSFYALSNFWNKSEETNYDNWNCGQGRGSTFRVCHALLKRKKYKRNVAAKFPWWNVRILWPEAAVISKTYISKWDIYKHYIFKSPYTVLYKFQMLLYFIYSNMQKWMKEKKDISWLLLDLHTN